MEKACTVILSALSNQNSGILNATTLIPLWKAYGRAVE